MTALYVLLIVGAVLALLSLLRVGARVEYSEGGLEVWLKLGPLSPRVFPLKKKSAKPSASQKPAPSRERAPRKGGSLDLLRQTLPLVTQAAGELRRKITVDELCLDLCWSLPDPAACAVGFGGINGALGAIWPLIDGSFRVKKHRIRTAVDFDRGSPTVWLTAQLTMSLGQLVSFGLRLALRFWKIYRSWDRQQTARPTTQQKKEAV